MKPKPPCKDCAVRHAYCHGNCDLYAEYLKANDEYRRAEHEISTLEGHLLELERSRGRKR